jgi:hypothetical protein
MARSGPFFRSEAADEEKPVSGRGREREPFGGHAVVHRRQPVRGRQRPALVVGYGDERIFRPSTIRLCQPLDVEPAVKRRDRPRGHRFEEGKVQQVDVKMKDVELGAPRANPIQHRKVRGHLRLQRSWIETKGAIARRHQMPARAAVPAGEQGHVVAERN